LHFQFAYLPSMRPACWLVIEASVYLIPMLLERTLLERLIGINNLGQFYIQISFNSAEPMGGIGTDGCTQTPLFRKKDW
jgi:hypothetical protein